MSERSWYLGIEGRQEGPFPESELRPLVAAGRLTRDTLVWTDGMPDWRRATEVLGFLFSAPPLSSEPEPAGSDAGSGSAITSSFGIWGLFWRILVIGFATLLVIPTPWAFTSFYRWLFSRIQVPQWPNLGFAGKAGDIWYVFMLSALCSYADFSHKWYLPYLLIPVQAAFAFIVLRWIVANLTSDGRPLGLAFAGDVLLYIGWYLFLYISILSIIGWAWVATAWMRWICRNIAGTSRSITFNARGLQMLWRVVVFALGCAFVIPIPWMLRWYARWVVSQFSIDAKPA